MKLARQGFATGSGLTGGHGVLALSVKIRLARILLKFSDPLATSSECEKHLERLLWILHLLFRCHCGSMDAFRSVWIFQVPWLRCRWLFFVSLELGFGLRIYALEDGRLGVSRLVCGVGFPIIRAVLFWQRHFFAVYILAIYFLNQAHGAWCKVGLEASCGLP